MDTVLGVSMAPTAVRMVLVEGENGDGLTVDEDNFKIADEPGAPSVSAADQVVSAILGTRQGAAEGGYQLTSTGVTWTDPIEAAALRDALAAHKVENVMLVSAFLAAAALAQAVGSQTNYAHTALLYIEPDTATLAIVDSADGSIADIRRHALPEDDEAAVAQLTALVSAVEDLDSHPGGVFVVGSGVDVPLIKPALQAATSLQLSTPEEPETALARGAALASAGAPLFASSTSAQAYAQDFGTGTVDPLALAPAYFDGPSRTQAGDTALAYSAVPDEFADAYTEVYTGSHFFGARRRDRRITLLGSSVAAIFVLGIAALVVSLAITIRPTAGVKPEPGHNVAPSQAAPAPAQLPSAPVQAPVSVPEQAPASVPDAPAPKAPVSVPQAPVSVPQAPVSVPQAPVQVPEAPVQTPAPVAPVAPAVPIPIPIPIFGGAPGFGGEHGGEHEHGGGGWPGGGGHGGWGGGGFGGGHGGGGFGGGHGGGGHR